jgi:hypothetical protein
MSASSSCDHLRRDRLSLRYAHRDGTSRVDAATHPRLRSGTHWSADGPEEIDASDVLDVVEG